MEQLDAVLLESVLEQLPPAALAAAQATCRAWAAIISERELWRPHALGGAPSASVGAQEQQRQQRQQQRQQHPVDWRRVGLHRAAARKWGAGALALSLTLNGHGGRVTCLAVLGENCITGSEDRSARVWELPRCAPAAPPAGGRLRHVLRLVEAPVAVGLPSVSLAITATPRTAQLWREGQALRSFEPLPGAAITCLALTDTRLLLGTSAGAVQHFDLFSGRAALITRHGAAVTCLLAQQQQQQQQHPGEGDDWRVMVGTRDGTVSGIACGTGAVLWQLPTRFPSRVLALHGRLERGGGQLFVLNARGQLVCWPLPPDAGGAQQLCLPTCDACVRHAARVASGGRQAGPRRGGAAAAAAAHGAAGSGGGGAWPLAVCSVAPGGEPGSGGEANPARAEPLAAAAGLCSCLLGPELGSTCLLTFSPDSMMVAELTHAAPAATDAGDRCGRCLRALRLAVVRRASLRSLSRRAEQRAGPAAVRTGVGELCGVPGDVLKGFLSQFSRLLVCQLAPDIPETAVQASVDDLLGNAGAAAPAPLDVRLEFKHLCKFVGCKSEECALCRNNPSKVCDDGDVFDHQYWVRDDGKGGQPIRSRCGADVALQLVERGSGAPAYLPDVRVKLYVINGQQLAASGPGDPPGGLYLSDDGHPLFAAAGAAPEPDGGVAVDFAQDERLGPAAGIPELQFLDKNSKFRVGGRTFKSFKLMARALRRDAGTGLERVIAQVETESFKVTTKKGYDGCRKAAYLYAHDPITDKTFANLGETTISNLKANFDGVETVEDLMALVQAVGTQPELETRLRETLNMARDTEKWRNLIRMLTDKVVWDDSMPRVFVVPGAPRPLGLLFRANRGQADYANPLGARVPGARRCRERVRLRAAAARRSTVALRRSAAPRPRRRAGVVLSQPTPSGQLRVVRLTDRLAAAAGRHVEALRALASAYWRCPRHPGWSLAPDSPVWEEANAGSIAEAFAEVLGGGDPTVLVDLHLATLQQAQAATGLAMGAAGLVRPATPESAGLGVHGLLGGGLGDGGWGAGGSLGLDLMQLQAGDGLAAATAAMSGGSGGAGVSDAGLHSADSAGRAAAAAAAAGFGGLGMRHHASLPAGGQAAGARARANAGLGGGAVSAPVGGGAGLTLPSALPPGQVFSAAALGAALPSLGGPSPFSVPPGGSLRTTSGGMADSEGGMSVGQVPQAPAYGPSSGVGVPQSGSLQSAGTAGAGALPPGMVPQGGAPRPSSSGSGLSGGGAPPPSSNTLLLQRAIMEGWPAPQVKAVLDQMSDDELRQLVASQPGTAAGVLARAGGDDAALGGGGGSGGGGDGLQVGGAAAPHGRADDGSAGAAAAAALAALFADADGTVAAPGGGARGSFDVSLTGDQLNTAAVLNLSGDSFADPGQWGDILENLRQLSSSSGGAGGAAAGGGGLAGSFSTEWIPELLFRLESESKDKDKAAKAGADAAAAGSGGGGGGGAAKPDPGAGDGGAAGSSAAAGGEAGDEAGADGKARRGKRERSKTAAGPTAEQLAQLQALFAADPNQLRSLSKGEAHLGSFGRHFPVARCSSQKQDVAQGAQVANPWNPGQAMSAAGVPPSPEVSNNAVSAGATPPHGRAVTTHAPGATPLGSGRIVSIGGAGPATTTEAGAAAVAAVTGQAAGDVPSSELLQMLAVIGEEGPPLGGGSAGGGGEGMLATSADAFGAHGGTPFLAQCPEMTHGAGQRDTTGKAGWISELFRSGSSWSSRSSSGLHSGGSGMMHSAPSTTSKGPPAGAG
ncbi:hypothetical protein HT031_000945 [Scenedesmus sp. PABB004]|nr:hypothetical protein HT031_000945 [Scenedesmus sp. PABB004]